MQHVETLPRASAIRNPQEGENASFRVYPGSLTAQHKRARERGTAMVTCKFVCVMSVFYYLIPLNSSGLWHSCPGMPGEFRVEIVSALISIPLCWVSRKSSVSCSKGADFRRLVSCILQGKRLRLHFCEFPGTRTYNPGARVGARRAGNWFPWLKCGRWQTNENGVQFYQNACRRKWEKSRESSAYSRKGTRTLTANDEILNLNVK